MWIWLGVKEFRKRKLKESEKSMISFFFLKKNLKIREGANINKSLLALSTVISKLSQKDGLYINFRDSKLTRLLQPCLGGTNYT